MGRVHVTSNSICRLIICPTSVEMIVTDVERETAGRLLWRSTGARDTQPSNHPSSLHHITVTYTAGIKEFLRTIFKAKDHSKFDCLQIHLHAD